MLVVQLQNPPHGPILEISGASRPALRNPPNPGEASEAAWNFEGLKFDDKGAITYHGATSFFQLPTTPASQEQNPKSSPGGVPSEPDDAGSRR